MSTDLKPQRFLLPVLAGIALLSSSLPASAANNYFLKFDGINGSSVQKGHEKAIEFNSFNWGVSVANSIGSGGVMVGKPTFSDFSWTQSLDASTGGLFTAATSGKAIKTAVVDFTTLTGGQSQTYFRMSFDNAFITHLDYSGNNGNVVNLAGSFAYGKVTLDYWTQDKSGKMVKLPSASYDLSTDKGSLSAVTALFARGLAGPQSVTAVPEPESYAMLLAGLSIIAAVARRRRLPS